MKKTYFLLAACFILNNMAYSQWIQINSSALYSIYDIEFINDSTGFFVGQDGVFKTNDYGNSWNHINFSSSGNHLFFTDPSTGYVTSYHDLFQSTDSGYTWLPIYNFSNLTLEGVVFVNANVGYLIASLYAPPGGSFIYKTVNAGINWTQVDSFPGIPTLVSITFVNSDTGFVVGYSGQVIKTYDAGVTWTIYDVPMVETLLSVCFPNDTTGFAAGYCSVSGSEIIKTIDAGNTWQQLPTGGTFNTALRAVYFPSVDTGYAAGEDGRIISTGDGGATWQVCTPTIPQDFFSTFFINNDAGFVMGTSGTILKTTNGGAGGVLTGVTSQYHKPGKLCIYPNPAKNTIEIVSASEGTLKIFTVTGQEKIKKEIKSNRIKIDVSILKPGIYFAQMTRENKVEVQKLIIE